MIDIGKKMRELIDILRQQGLNGVDIPGVRSECEDKWSPHYAIVCNLYWDYDDKPYFNEDQFKQDLQEMVKKHFAEPDVETVVLLGYKGEKKPAKGSISITFYYQAQEIEVHRVGEPVD